MSMVSEMALESRRTVAVPVDVSSPMDDNLLSDIPSGPSGTVVGPRKTEATAPPVTTSPTPDSFEEPAGTPRVQPKPLEMTPHEDVLLCTVSSRVYAALHDLEDGICTLLFYTAAHYDRGAKDFRGAYDEYSFDTFRTWTKSTGGNSRTGYGVSFDYVDAEAAYNVLKTPDGKNKFSKMWNDIIYHYGLLHVWESADALKANNARLKLLSEIKSRQDALGSNKNGHRVIGFQFQAAHDLDKFNDVISYLQSQYPITILITITHLFKIPPNSFSMGPSEWESHHVHSMNEALKKLKATTISGTVTAIPSFTMAAISWKTTSTWDATRPNWQTTYSTPVLYSQVCDNLIQQKPVFSPSTMHMYTGWPSNKDLITFDTADTMLAKMQMYFAAFDPLPKKHGWALYDVDYDDYINNCSLGSAFVRLKAIKQYLVF
ncbi:hypothetical protein V5799_021118 [Amblyomma americanum]|uniref:Uncharacterized protein n=1 Tax=Amblyomma americanum TaxID=6943 RepID=A0AAQ4FPU1_AMBAM